MSKSHSRGRNEPEQIPDKVEGSVDRSPGAETIGYTPRHSVATPEPSRAATQHVTEPSDPLATVETGADQSVDERSRSTSNRAVSERHATVAVDAETPDRSGPDRPAVAGYEILSELGRGGMGVVYRARHTKLDRVVALKMILAGAHAGSDQLARFYAEAQAVAQLQHPNIVQIYEIGEQGGLPFFSLEYLDGGSLSQKAAGKPQPPADAARTVEVLARAMQFAHQHGVIHRDLKPANILLAFDGEPKITDFGLAKRLETPSSAQTRSGAILGTPSYMAPEQAMGDVHQVGPLTDVYSLGAILYELITGRPPFAGPTPMDTVQQVVRDEPVAPSALQPALPRDVETICLKCLQKEPPKRYASAGELADDLRRFLNGEPIVARPVSASERLWRWCRRNPVVSSMAATIAAVLVVATAISLYQRNVAVEARARAELNERQAKRAADAAQVARELADANAAAEKAARKLADDNAEAARQAQQLAEENAQIANQQGKLAVDTLYGVVTKVQQKVRSLPGPGVAKLRQELLQDVFAGLEQVTKSEESAAIVGRIRTAAFQHMGDIARELGKSDEAERHYKQSLAIIESMLADDPQNHVHLFNAATLFDKLTKLSVELEDISVARQYLTKAIELRKQLSNVEIEDPQLTAEMVRDSLSRSYLTETDLAMMLGDPPAAWQAMSRYLEMRIGHSFASPREFVESVTADEELDKKVQPTLQRHIGRMAFHLGDTATARSLSDRSLAKIEAAVRRSPDNRTYQNALTESLAAFGDLEMYLDNPAAALKFYVRSHERYLNAAAEDPDAVQPRRLLSFSYYRLASAHLANGNPTEAGELYKACLSLREGIAADDPRNVHKQIDWMTALARCGRQEEAAAMAAKLSKTAGGDSSVLYYIACVYGACAQTVTAGMSSDALPPELAALHRTYIDATMETINQAIAVAYKDHVSLERDPDLRAVRNDPRFRKLVESLK